MIIGYTHVSLLSPFIPMTMTKKNVWIHQASGEYLVDVDSATMVYHACL